MGLLDELFGGATGNGVDLEAILQKAAAGLQRHNMGPLEAQSTAARVAAMPERVEAPQDVRSYVDQGSAYAPTPQATAPAATERPQYAGRQPTTQQRIMNAFAHLKGSGADIDRAADTENMTVRALMSRGMDQDTAMTLSRNPAALQQVLLTLVPKRAENSKLGPGDAVFGPDGKLIARNDVAAPKDLVVPAGGGVFRDGQIVATQPKQAPPMSATDKNAIFKAENELPAVKNTIDKLKRAKELNGKIYEGHTAGVRGEFLGKLGDWSTDAGKATVEWSRLMSGSAISEMSETLKGASTDREMGEFLKIIADPTTPADVRERTIDRAIKLAEHSEQIFRDRFNQLREGTYYDTRGGASGRDDGGGWTTLGTGVRIREKK